MDARNLRIVGVLTWLGVGMPILTRELHTHPLATPHALAWLTCYTAFVVLFLFTTRDVCVMRLRIIFAIAQTAVAIGSLALQPDPLGCVLLVIIAAQIGALPVVAAIAWIVVQSLAFWWVTRGVASFWDVLSFVTFQLFAFFSLRIAHHESEARQALAAANAELQVAAGLLDIGSRSEERLRIARDLHDVLGHHLTALSLNLEVANHVAEGKAREHIEKSQAMAKTLLNDVRNVVSQLRNDDPVDLASALRSLQQVIDRPALNLEMNDELSIRNPAVAQTALRAVQEIVTNAVRHSGARNLWLKLTTDDHALAIAARDDGSGADHIQLGNGLRGMRERIEQLQGTMDVSSMRGHGFAVNVRIPIEEAAA